MKLTSISIALGLTAGLVAMSAPAMAQVDDPQSNPLADFETQNTDPFSGRGNTSSSMMQLMHRIMQGDRPDSATFNADQREKMNDAMSNFRRLQMKRLRQQQLKAKNQNPSTAKRLPILLKPTPQTGTLKLAPMSIKPLVLPSN